jgi:hypothetical protein
VSEIAEAMRIRDKSPEDRWKFVSGRKLLVLSATVFIEQDENRQVGHRTPER